MSSSMGVCQHECRGNRGLMPAVTLGVAIGSVDLVIFSV